MGPSATVNGADTPDSPPRNSAYMASLWTGGLALAWCVIDRIFAPTLIVTPIAPWIWWGALLAGAIGGIWLGLVVAGRELRKAGPKAAGKRTALATILCALGLLLGPWVANRAMWRVADMAQFWNGTGRIESAAFPIRSVSSGKGSSFAVSIGSRGQRDALPISKQDFQLLRAAGRLQRPWAFCLSLRRQQEGQAVRIWLPPRPRPSFRGLTVTRCPASAQWID